MQKEIYCGGPGNPSFPEKTVVTPVKVWIHPSGMIANHNYSCPVCREYHAILDFDTGIMQPCSRCQMNDYRVVQHVDLWIRILRFITVLMFWRDPNKRAKVANESKGEESNG